MRLAALSLSTLMLVVAVVPLATASPNHDPSEETYGSFPGDPRVITDSGGCYNATLEIEGTACSVLYGHPFDILNKIMINTQRVPDYWEDMARGFAPNAGYEEVWDLNQLTMESSPGFVEYKGAGVKPDLHTERGITKTVEIDTSVPIVGYWYLSADYDDGYVPDDTGGHGPDVGVLPCLTVRMTLQTGRFWQGQGDTLAVGETTKTVVSAQAAGEGDSAALAEAPCPGDRTGAIVAPEDVTEFQVVLEPLEDTIEIPGSEGFIVHTEWYQWAPGDPDASNKLYQYQWNFHTGPDYLNRVVLPTKTNVWIESVDAITFGGELFVQAKVNSPWGSYDVDPASLQMRLYDADGNEVPISHLKSPILRYSTGHDGHFDPVTATFPWDYKSEGLKPGTYTVEMSARNWQHLAEASGTTTFVIPEGKKDAVVPTDEGDQKPVVEEESPALAIPALLALLGVVLAGLRRRTG